jgi:hypothetical protein
VDGIYEGAFDQAEKFTLVEDNVVLRAVWFDERLPQFAVIYRKTVASMNVECDLCSSKKRVYDVLGGLKLPLV